MKSKSLSLFNRRYAADDCRCASYPALKGRAKVQFDATRRRSKHRSPFEVKPRGAARARLLSVEVINAFTPRKRQRKPAVGSQPRLHGIETRGEIRGCSFLSRVRGLRFSSVFSRTCTFCAVIPSSLCCHPCSVVLSSLQLVLSSLHAALSSLHVALSSLAAFAVIPDVALSSHARCAVIPAAVLSSRQLAL
jgi:hypothetical protein